MLPVRVLADGPRGRGPEHLWVIASNGSRCKGVLCLACADVDHLAFLPSGDAALIRRARKHSTLSAVVLKWSRARKRYERQSLLIEEQAIEQAEQECPADSEVRARRRERQAARRAQLDQEFADATKLVRTSAPSQKLGS